MVCDDCIFYKVIGESTDSCALYDDRKMAIEACAKADYLEVCWDKIDIEGLRRKKDELERLKCERTEAIKTLEKVEKYIKGLRLMLTDRSGGDENVKQIQDNL